MYAIPGCTHLGVEKVASFGELIDALKRRQMFKPQAKIAMALGGEKFRVNYLPSGHVELDGLVPSLPVERELEQAIAAIGAELVDVMEN